MRKFLLYPVAAILSLGIFAACSTDDASGVCNDSMTDTATYTATSDTVSELLGRINGLATMQQLLYYKANVDSTYDIDGFFDGLALVIDRRHPAAYDNGLAFGVQMAAEISPMESRGLNINHTLLVNTFGRVAASDTVTDRQQSDAYALLMQLTAPIDSLANLGNVRQSLADSIADAYATLAGYALVADRLAFENAEGRAFDMPTFLKGVNTIISTSRPTEFIAGTSNGLNILNGISEIEKTGLNIRRETVLEYFNGCKNLKTVDSEQITSLADRLHAIVERQNQRFNQAEEQRLAKSPEAIQNAKTGEALVNKMKAANPQAKTTDSGLTYIIYNPGKGDLITDSAMVTTRYTGSHLDGKVFDTNSKGTLSPITSIPGVREALKMLRPGAKATFWIPGNLAYGARGVPQAEIGPMETLVFDFEILDVK